MHPSLSGLALQWSFSLVFIDLPHIPQRALPLDDDIVGGGDPFSVYVIITLFVATCLCG